MDKVAALANNKKTDEAVAQLKENSIKAVEDFGGGNVPGAVAKFLNGFSDMATEHPAATFELTAQSLPQMYVLAKNALLGVSTLSAAGYDEAVREFVKEYGRQPDQSEKALAGILALSAAGLDAIGAKAVFGGKDLLKSVLGFSSKTGIKTAKATVVAAEEAAKEIGKSSIKSALGIITKPVKAVVTSRPVRSVPIEGGTEGAQNILSQLAAKQDLSKVDVAEALVDTTIGGISGAHISSAIVTGEVAIIKLPQKVQKEARKIHKKIVEAGIGETRAVLAQAVKNKDIKTAIKAVAQDFGDRTVEERSEQLNTLEQLIISSPISAEEALPFSEQVNQLAQAHNRLIAGGTVEAGTVTEAVDIVTTENNKDITEEQTKSSIAFIVDSVGTTADVTLKLVKKVLGSESFDPENGIASEADIATLKSYRNLLETTEKVEDVADATPDTARVNKDVLEGNPKTGFIGIKQHLKNFTLAIAQNNAESARTVVSKLKEFRAAQAQKLQDGFKPTKVKQLYDDVGNKLTTNYIPHKANVAAFITQEIEALDAAIEFAENENNKRFQITPEKSNTVYDRAVEVFTTIAARLKKAGKKTVVEQHDDLKSLAGTRAGVVKLNLKAIAEDYENGMAYLDGKGKGIHENTSVQKEAVFANVDIEAFKQFIKDNGGIDAYIEFIFQHELAHIANKDSKKYPQKEDGTADLSHPDAIAIEIAANNYAFAKIGFETTKEIVTEPVVPQKEEKKPEVIQAKEEAIPEEVEVEEPTEAPGHINLLDPEYKDMINDLSDVTIPEDVDVDGVVHVIQNLISRELKRIDKRINGLAFVFKECG